MGSIIGELINIETTAGQLTKKVEEEQKKLPLNINRRVQEIDAATKKVTEEKIKAIQRDVYEQSQKEVEEIKLRTRERAAMLEQDDKDNHEKWEDEIFRRIIGR